MLLNSIQVWSCTSVRVAQTLRALLQQFVDDAGTLDGKKQDLKVAKSANVDSATVPLQHHQFELPMDGKDDLETFSMPVSPHDRDVM